MSSQCQHHADPGEIDSLVENCVAQLRQRGLRRSRGLEVLLRHLAEHHRPVTLGELAAVPGLDGLDQATIYRLVMKLEETGLVRRLGLHDRSMYFQLVVPGHHHDYLVCTQCGKIEDLAIHCPVEALEREIMESSGYRQVYHELEFYGVCPACAAAAA